MRWFPRRSRQVWVFFLLFVCLVGVYLSYSRLHSSADLNPPVTEPHIYQYDRDLHNSWQSRFNIDDDVAHPNIKEKSHISNLGLHANRDSLNGGDFNNGPVQVLRNLENDDDYVTNEEIVARLKTLILELSPSNWKTAMDVDEIMVKVKSELMDLGVDSRMSCREITAMRVGRSRYQGFYGKTNVDMVELDYQTELVVKSVGRDTQLKADCMRMDFNEERCAVMGNYKLMRELLFHVVLKHPSVIDMQGFCLRGETIDIRIPKKGAMIVTEQGEQIVSGTLAKFFWKHKVEMSIAMMKLLLHMESSPVGTLGFDKLHLPDFVLVGADIKLVDLDNIHIGELICKEDSDCTIPEMSRKKITCVTGVCKGRNALNNLLWMYRILLLQLLQTEQGTLQKLLQDIQDLKVTSEEVLQQLEAVLDGGETAFVRPKNRPKFHVPSNDKPTVVERGVLVPASRNDVFEQQDEDQGMDDPEFRVRRTPRPQMEMFELSLENEKNKASNDRKQEYTRLENSNFPGVHDYTCSQSRVSWGCIVTVHSLYEAKDLCDYDTKCKSFVIFSANPEQNAMMTMVMKKSADSQPDTNYGATLFIKKTSEKKPRAKPTTPAPFAVTLKPRSEQDVRTCLKKVYNQTKSARVSRERRLLTHLGLKGFTEDDWKMYAKSVKIVKYLGTSQLSPSDAKGGRFKVQFLKNAIDLKKGEYIIENGPFHHHTGYLMVYHLDRILGLYHTPPAVGRKLSVSEMEIMRFDSQWIDKFSQFNQSDGSGILGVMSVSMPPVMKTEKLSISPRENMVPSVEAFSRKQKLQLEYVLLWSITKLMQPQHGYLGYKGHLVHFEADLAFINLKKSLLPYLYHCQFPSVAYKELVCYKCPTEAHKMTKICGLGQQVVKRMVRSGFRTSDLSIGPLTPDDIVQVINNNAASVMNIVEHCIRNFSREKVLY